MLSLALLSLSSLVSPAVAAPTDVPMPSALGPFSGTPIEDVVEDAKEKKTEAQKKVEERLKALEESNKGKAARVVVLQWKNTDVDYANDTLARNVRSRIARPDAKFYPDVDLYQTGRKEPDEALRPLDQRASVPDDVIPLLESAVADIKPIPWDAITDTEWGERAAELRSLTEQIWFVDRPELRQPLFDAYVQLGRAAGHANNPIPPFYEQVAGNSVNYGYYLAAAMASRTPDLMNALTDPEPYAEVNYLMQQINQGAYAPMTMNFDINGDFDPANFIQNYELFLNGVGPVEINNKDALVNVPPGKMDVLLKRTDGGFGMSLRVESVKVEKGEILAPREQARKRMGLDFIDQLLENEEQCIPDVSGDILNYLSIYSKLHPESDIFIAVPKAGSVNKILLWRWVPEKGNLIRVNDNTGGYPIRFVALAGSGMIANGVTAEKTETILPALPPVDPGALPMPGDLASLLSPTVSGIPFSYELRGHWNRLMVGFELSANLGVQGGWADVARTGTRNHAFDPVTGEFEEVNNDDRHVGNRILTETNSEGNVVPVLDDSTFQRAQYLNIAGVLGREAAFGFGPRLGARFGWINRPHVLDFAVVGGIAKKVEDLKEDGRVKILADASVFGGMLVPFGDTISLIGGDRINGAPIFGRVSNADRSVVCSARTQCSTGTRIARFGAPRPNFGLSAKVGVTF